jgi:hypothetical protein
MPSNNNFFLGGFVSASVSILSAANSDHLSTQTTTFTTPALEVDSAPLSTMVQPIDEPLPVNTVLLDQPSLIMKLPPLRRNWRKRDQVRFDALAIKLIDSSMTPEEKEEWEVLKQFRDDSLPGRSADEIMRSAQGEKILNQMQALLSKYVQFQSKNGHKTPRYA